MQKKNMRTSARRGATVFLGLAATSVPFAMAADFPSKPLRLVTGSAPGGGSDTVARTIAEKLNERFGQPVLVDNRAGAGGTIGADIVAKAPPDGYTWLVATSSSMVVNPAMQKLPYEIGRAHV